jgi:hypothetical protein
MSTVTEKRDRTYADRRSFLLSEKTIETASKLANPVKVLTEGVLPDVTPPSNPAWQKNRDKVALKERMIALKKEAFYRVLGELTYSALPLDESEKNKYHTVILEQTEDFIKIIPDWNLTKMGNELLEISSSVVNSLDDKDPNSISDAISESIKSGELKSLMNTLIETIENRVIDAIILVKESAARLEQGIASVTPVSSGNTQMLTAPMPERALAKKMKLERQHKPGLLESLFISNKKLLSESATDGQEISSEVLMLESVAQYTLLEVASSIGILSLNEFDITTLTRQLIK